MHRLLIEMRLIQMRLMQPWQQIWLCRADGSDSTYNTYCTSTYCSHPDGVYMVRRGSAIRITQRLVVMQGPEILVSVVMKPRALQLPLTSREVQVSKCAIESCRFEAMAPYQDPGPNSRRTIGIAIGRQNRSPLYDWGYDGRMRGLQKNNSNLFRR